jgi:PST family polysaccharide transporter
MTERMDSWWVKLLPAVFRRRFESRIAAQQVIANTFWLSSDYVFRLSIGVVVNVWMARYLGPQQFGQLSFATAFAGLFAAFSTLGLDVVIVRDLAKSPHAKAVTLGSAWILKFLGSIAAIVLAVTAIAWIRPDDGLSFWLVFLFASVFLFQSADVIDMWFRSSLRSKLSVIPKTIAITAGALGKSSLMLVGAPLIAFAWMGLAEAVVGSVALLGAFIWLEGDLKSWRIHFGRVRELLKEVFPLALSAMVIILYMRIDKIMLGELLDDEAVGLYTAATKIFEVLYFIPSAFVMSLGPALVRARESDAGNYLARVEEMFSVVAIGTILIALPISVFANPLITFIFGPNFTSAAPVLQIHIWALVFSALGVASGQYLLLEGFNSIILQRTALGAAVNILLNVLWIPRYGIVGAAWASLIAYGIATCFLFQNVASRRCLNLMVKSVFYPRVFAALWR